MIQDRFDSHYQGESYAGVYVPTLAEKVTLDGSMKLKGIAVGNGISNYDINDNSALYLLYYHGFMGENEWKNLNSKCCSAGSGERCDFKQAGRTLDDCK